ncbi:copper chaperone [Pseudohoeflea suaedae]|uniref:Copper chaperone n=1 Tax=Pseudohoeflea suaedae TaxID=877384 RepID=A0A4R5PHP3_9HYPH|nr:heavy-metal-associated domain-containing protein [Pseudohoeflea suaedae]TDH34428.1 copper chaperone [Pseudohoeflea suaedae]
MAITLKIEGMHCGGCVSSVEKAARSIDGVDNVTVSLDKGELTADAQAGKLDQLVAAIEDSGFDVVSRRTD